MGTENYIKKWIVILKQSTLLTALRLLLVICFRRCTHEAPNSSINNLLLISLQLNKSVRMLFFLFKNIRKCAKL